MGQSILYRGAGGGKIKPWEFVALLKSYGVTISQNFSYTGAVQSYTVPLEGVYKMTIYGGAGGASMNNGSVSGSGGQGGTSIGYKLLKEGDILYIAVGGQGTNGRKSNAPGGWNGGGYGTWDNSDDEGSGGGGGATHIALNSNRGVLSAYSDYRSEILLVAGGGGGKAWTGGVSAGGGLSVSTRSGKAVNQTTGYAFGQGQNASGTGASNGVGGAGGGWYGGYYQTASDSECGDGGSGYIGGCPEFIYNEITYTSTTSNGGRSGNGYAIIELVA